MPNRAEVRRFGREVKRGDLFTNRFREHGLQPYHREVEVVLDVRSTALFVVKDLSSGKSTVMRSRTLMMRWARLSPGPKRTQLEDVQQ
jgi:hypothetical protein